jgi:hypothetical protein
MGLERLISMSSVLAPSYSVETETIGYEMSGKRSIARCWKAITPRRMIPMAIINRATGFFREPLMRSI